MKKGVSLVIGFVFLLFGIFAFSSLVNATYECSLQGNIFDMNKCSSDTNGRSCSGCTFSEKVCLPFYYFSSCTYIGISPSGWDVQYIKTSSLCTINWACPDIDSTPYCSAGLGYKRKYGCLDEGSCNIQTVRETSYDSNCLSITSANWTKNNVNIISANLNEMINLSIFGFFTMGRALNFTIYNSSKSIVYSYNISAQSTNSAYTNWSFNKVGIFYFNASIVGTNISKLSSHLTVSYFSVCGNAINETGEQCDDGNLINSDGCNSTCKIENGWNCITNSSGTSICTPNSGCNNLCSPLGNISLWCSADYTQVMMKTCVINNNGCLNWTVSSVNETCSTYERCSNGQCIQQMTEIISCSEYIDEYNCTHDSYDVSLNEVNNFLFEEFADPFYSSTEDFCDGDTYFDTNNTCDSYAKNCGCSWDDEDGTCSMSYDVNLSCSEGSFQSSIPCSFTTETINNCNTTGIITYNYIGSPLSCGTTERNVPCVSTTKLPFFGIIELMITCLLIACIYFFLNKKHG